MGEAPGIVLPSRDDDPVAARAATLIGGGPGRRARLGAHRWWTPLRVLLAFVSLALLLGWAQKAPCRDPGNWQHDYQYTRMCYSDVEALYFAERLNEGATPYYDHPVEYPVVVGAVMGFAAKLANALPAGDRPEGFFDITALLLAVGGLVAVVATARLGGRRPWDAALFALAPGLVLHAFTNWDLIAVALTALGMLAWARRSPALAGALLGLGAASKLYPALLLIPLLALCWRAQRLRAWLVAAGSAVGVWVLVNVPVALTANSFVETGAGFREVESGGENAWSRFWRLNQERVADHDTLWHWAERMIDDGTGARAGLLTAALVVVLLALVGVVLGAGYLVVSRLPTVLAALGALALVGFVGFNAIRLFDLVDAVLDHPAGDPFVFPVGPLNAAVAMGTAAVMLSVVALALHAPRRPRWPQLCFLALAGFLLVNKVYSPQYVLWLIPLAVLARPRWPAFLAWQAAECVLFLTRFLYLIHLGSANKGIEYGWFAGAVWVRDVTLGVLTALVVRDVLRPEHDPVRQAGADDPAGGVLDGAADRPAVA